MLIFVLEKYANFTLCNKKWKKLIKTEQRIFWQKKLQISISIYVKFMIKLKKKNLWKFEKILLKKKWWIEEKLDRILGV